MKQQLYVLEGDQPYSLSRKEIMRLVEIFDLTPEKVEALKQYGELHGLAGWSDFMGNVGKFLKGGWNQITGKDKQDQQKNEINHLKEMIELQKQQQMENQNKPNMPLILAGGGVAMMMMMMMMRRK